MKACRHAGRECKCPTNVDIPQYVGGQSTPADLWGAAPLRAALVEAIEAFFMHRALTGGAWPAGDLADDLIAKGLFPDELRYR